MAIFSFRSRFITSTITLLVLINMMFIFMPPPAEAQTTALPDQLVYVNDDGQAFTIEYDEYVDTLFDPQSPFSQFTKKQAPIAFGVKGTFVYYDRFTDLLFENPNKKAIELVGMALENPENLIPQEETAKYGKITGFHEGTGEPIFDFADADYSLQGTLTDGENPISNGSMGIYIDDEYYTMVFSYKDGHFSADLPDGEYNIPLLNISMETSLSIDVQFKILNGKMYQDGILIDNLVIQIPTITLRGTVTDLAGQPAGGLFILGENIFTNDHFGSPVNGTGEFVGRLEDGDYELSILDWPGIQAIFSIKNGELYIGKDKKERLELQIPGTRVVGSIHDQDNNPLIHSRAFIDSVDNQEYSTYGYMYEDGYFYLFLKDGEYFIDFVLLADDTRFEVDQYFTVEDGKITVDGTEIPSLDIVIPLPET